jgi:pimeloyl-ACP methyl ester carboxylesterase
MLYPVRSPPFATAREYATAGSGAQSVPCRAMRPSVTLLLALLVAACLGGAAHAQQSCTNLPASPAAAPGLSLSMIDPVSLPAIGPDGFDLRSFIADGGLARTPAATGLVHDGSSAVLLVFGSPISADVCFSAGPDLLFEPYLPGFRKAVSPVRQAGTWLVPAAQLVTIGGRHYAAVLVDTVTTAFNPANATAPIAAGQCCWSGASASLADQAPPVVLIHGLWGNSDSLSSVQQYLDGHSPWNRTKISYVQPIQYSITQPFDGAEPAQVVHSEVTGLLAELAQHHVAAGRVDVVAHSMGGLVARHYAGLSTFRSLGNRMQGAFHTVVTLDTPELGSALAPFLLANWNAEVEAPIFSTPYAIWTAACGLFPVVNVEQCFAGLGMPLAAQGAPLDSGAVYSLTPGGPSLTSASLAPAQIPGAAWRVIDAVSPSNGALGFEVNNLIAAIYSNPNKAPTVTTLLQNLPNDAIVALPSQTSTASAPVETSFTGFSHTKAPDGSILDVFGLNDANVLASNPVDEAAACWLLQAGQGACTTPPTNAAPVAAAVALRVAGPAVLADRLTVTAPARLTLAQPASLPIRLTTLGLVRLSLRQHDPVSGAVATDTLDLGGQSGPSAAVALMPRLLGQVDFTLTGVFADGAVSTQRFSATVEPAAEAPASFAGDINGRHVYLSLSIPGPYRLFPVANFGGVPGKVDLRLHVDYALDPGGDSIVGLGSDGTLQPLRQGDTAVEAQFGTATDRIAVTVGP